MLLFCFSNCELVLRQFTDLKQQMYVFFLRWQLFLARFKFFSLIRFVFALTLFSGLGIEDLRSKSFKNRLRSRPSRRG